MIKFRGKSVLDNKVIYGDLLHNRNELLILKSHDTPAETIQKDSLAQLVAYDELGNELYIDDAVVDITTGVEMPVSEYYIETSQIGTYIWKGVTLKDYTIRLMEQRGFQYIVDPKESDVLKHIPQSNIKAFTTMNPVIINCFIIDEDSYLFEFFMARNGLTILSDKFTDVCNDKQFTKRFKTFSKRVSTIQESLD